VKDQIDAVLDRTVVERGCECGVDARDHAVLFGGKRCGLNDCAEQWEGGRYAHARAPHLLAELGDAGSIDNTAERVRDLLGEKDRRTCRPRRSGLLRAHRHVGMNAH